MTDLHIGWDQIGGTNNVPTRQQGFTWWVGAVTAATNGTITGGKVYCAGSAGASLKVRLGVYKVGADVASSTLVASSDLLTVADTATTGAWRDVTGLSGSIVAGASYVLVVVTDYTSGTFPRLPGDSGAWGDIRINALGSTTLPSTLSGWQLNNSYRPSAYAIVTPAASGVTGTAAQPLPELTQAATVTVTVPAFTAAAAQSLPLITQSAAGAVAAPFTITATVTGPDVQLTWDARAGSGYAVERDGAIIAFGITDQTYTDVPGEGEHTYRVGVIA